MTQGKCPFSSTHGSRTSNSMQSNQHWWPNQLNLKILRLHSQKSNPMWEDFNYKNSFQSLDYQGLKKDLTQLMTDSQDWWPADWGHYGGLFIRMAWHSAGTYRVTDGRGGGGTGNQRFAPINSWPDNGNLDKARRLLWPIKKKYGNKISWADLMILAGNVALESMGFETLGFGGGREDIWEPEEDTYWGSEKKWLDDKRYSGERDLENPLAAVQMGLIYVNPEGPNGNPDPVASGGDVRETFARMAMNDEETVALVAGGHTFGKAHGAGDPALMGAEPEAASVEEMGFGWKNDFKTGKGIHTTTSGIEGAWKPNPTRWDHGYFEMLFKYEWELVKSPAGAHQWLAKDVEEKDLIPDAHDPSIKHRPMMTTADLSLRFDPVYEKISKRFLQNPQEFATAFARAWFKLTHRDMGPVSRYLGPEVPKEHMLWQDPISQDTKSTIGEAEAETLKTEILSAGISIAALVEAAWASASTFRHSDMRGGANGARICLEPQISWESNRGIKQSGVLEKLQQIQANFNSTQKKNVSLADLIVLGGAAAIEKAAANVGYQTVVPVLLGRGDAKQEQTDIDSIAVLEPVADGFRNFVRKGMEKYAVDLLIDKAQLLNLTIPELTVLVGGMRSLHVNALGVKNGLFVNGADKLNNHYFVELLDMKTTWKQTSTSGLYEGYDRLSDKVIYTATNVDLIFGSNSELRAVAEVYASDDSFAKFVEDFIAAWNKVMNADRFDI